MTTSINISLPHETATLVLAGQLARATNDKSVIFLYGPLGAGKTTFSRGFLRELGYTGTVKSPTYTLVEPYSFDGFTVFHFDLYRVQDPFELELMGMRDYVQPHSICLIEWPEQGGEFVPSPDLSCYLEVRLSGRAIKIVANSAHGEEIVKRLT